MISTRSINAEVVINLDLVRTVKPDYDTKKSLYCLLLTFSNGDRETIYYTNESDMDDDYAEFRVHFHQKEAADRRY
jgi:hypothetical protein